MLRDLAATRPSDGHRLHPDARRLRLPLRGDRLAHRHVQAWELSNTLDASFCVRAMTVYDVPEIYDSDRRGVYPAAAGRRGEIVDEPSVAQIKRVSVLWGKSHY